MTLAQHGDNTTAGMSISAGGGNETGANIDSVTLTTAGAFSGQAEVEAYFLANATGNVFTQVNGNVSVKGGSANDRIITSEVDNVRVNLTVDLTSGGRDTVVIHNAAGGITTSYTDANGNISSNLVDTFWNGAGGANSNNAGSETEQSGGTVLNGFIASMNADTDLIYSNQNLNFTGTWAESVSNWDTNGGGTSAVMINGFTAGDVAGGDVIETNWGTIDTTNATFVENAVLNQTDLSGVGTGSVIELNADSSFQLVNYTNLSAVAAMLSNSGDGDALLGLNNGNYTIVIYQGTGNATSADPADAYIYQITVDEGDGLDFVSNEGTYNYDADSIELIGVLMNIGANALTGQNFA
jgi:hypothetical protein